MTSSSVVTAPRRRPSESRIGVVRRRKLRWLAPTFMGSKAASPSTGDGFLHADGVADGFENFVAAGCVGEDQAVSGGLAEDLGCGLIELEDVAFAVGDDDGLKDGLEDSVGELELHLASASLCVAEFTQTNGESVEFGGENAEGIVTGPLDAMVEVALGDAAGITGEVVDGAQNKGDGQGENEDDGQRKKGRQRGDMPLRELQTMHPDGERDARAAMQMPPMIKRCEILSNQIAP